LVFVNVNIGAVQIGGLDTVYVIVNRLKRPLLFIEYAFFSFIERINSVWFIGT